MRKTLFLLLLTVISVGVIVGCGSNQENNRLSNKIEAVELDPFEQKLLSNNTSIAEVYELDLINEVNQIEMFLEYDEDGEKIDVVPLGGIKGDEKELDFSEKYTLIFSSKNELVESDHQDETIEGSTLTTSLIYDYQDPDQDRSSNVNYTIPYQSEKELGSKGFMGIGSKEIDIGEPTALGVFFSSDSFPADWANEETLKEKSNDGTIITYNIEMNK
ncbi:hypothetical protein [Texcoconibacillus texcoconensis]|uniref:Lipoprotein n=1 Tax=Texcoconibacillus texcoconensis TaxID=1095777 RepID=A0A840QTA0_9BACI|nr:hypothetical protein [Texcoconibacillus texcoconensis]MBB5174529.1 hypothetical protein [Texcoconibacillus texcoconensis]